MYAWQIDSAANELRGLRHEEVLDAVLAALTFGLALAASELARPFAVPLLVGALSSIFLTARAFWRHWDILDRLLLERDAYRIAEVRRRADRSASMTNRQLLAASITRLLGHPYSACAARVLAEAEGLEALARELDDPGLILDPLCAVACERLLREVASSPLYNEALPAGDTGVRIRQIRAGFDLRPAEESPLTGAVRS